MYLWSIVACRWRSDTRLSPNQTFRWTSALFVSRLREDSFSESESFQPSLWRFIRESESLNPSAELHPCSCPDSERLNSRSEESEEFCTVFMMLTGARGRVFAVFVVLMCVSGVCESGCADRPSPKCCPGRNNKCAEFTGRRTVCYCDTYCQKTGDCCEDYQTTCRISGEV